MDSTQALVSDAICISSDVFPAPTQISQRRGDEFSSRETENSLNQARKREAGDAFYAAGKPDRTIIHAKKQGKKTYARE